MAEVIIKNIVKTFTNTSVLALNNVSLTIASGELFGLIGPDGAGKTTLFRILATLLFPDSGSAEVAGFDTIKDYQAIRKIVGYMPGKFSLYQDLIVEARKNDLKVVFLWFGTWKNSMSSHVPAWVKLNQEKFPRSKDESGKSQEILSCFSENVFQAGKGLLK